MRYRTDIVISKKKVRRCRKKTRRDGKRYRSNTEAKT